VSEHDMRGKIIEVLRPLDAVSVENRCGPGTPDVNYIGGWMELKWLREWPKRPETPVKLDHDLEPQQRAWLRRRRNRGGVAIVMLQCRREWLLFDGIVASDVIGLATRQGLIDAAIRYWPDGLVAEELIAELRALNETKLP